MGWPELQVLSCHTDFSQMPNTGGFDAPKAYDLMQGAFKSSPDLPVLAAAKLRRSPMW